tara:strand:- start:11443 stop:13797 length:2355 start_codon:yes stop_codon:yes gene_type:complete
MTPAANPVLKDLVLVGGGHSHVTVLREFGMDPMPGVRLTLISRDAHAPYSGMLPGLIAGHYTFEETNIDLGPLARFAKARFLHDEAVGVDTNNRAVLCRDHPPVAFDVLSINIGSTPGLRVPGAKGTVVPVKPIDGFWPKWKVLRDRCLQRRNETHIGVVGGGAGGVELLLSVQYSLDRLLERQGRSSSHLYFHLATAGDEILPTHNSRVRAKVCRVLRERGVEVMTNSEVTAIEGPGCRLTFKKGGGLDLDEVLWVTTARAASWVEESGFEVDDRGFIRVRDTLQTLTDADIFAAGDIGAVVDHPRPKAGVFAVRQGPPLTENIRLRLLGEAAKPFRPQEKFLSLVSTGDKYAVVSRGNWAGEGAWAWRWKDFIDQRFMQKFNKLPEMYPAKMDQDVHLDPRLVGAEHAAELVRAGVPEIGDLPKGLTDTEKALGAISTFVMRCGGCGSKVGSTMLDRVLAKLAPSSRPDVVIGLDEPDDAAVVDVPEGKQLVQSVDFFRSFIGDPFVFGKVAANHALGDIFAMGAEPQTALATVTIPYGVESKVEADLLQLLSGALNVLSTENTALVGGHTSEGSELALGLTVTGFVDAGTAMRKSGMNTGDILVLTKPLGTGALFAADMRCKAKGRWVCAALCSMTQSNRAAADCLIGYGTTAMTDVSGFGLLGHLVEMTKASGVATTVTLDIVPALDGTLEVMDKGIFSSLHAENVRLRRAISGMEKAARNPAYPLIFDPQTAGGLLASVPADNAESCVNALRELGYESAIAIGEVREADAGQPAVQLLV